MKKAFTVTTLLIFIACGMILSSGCQETAEQITPPFLLEKQYDWGNVSDTTITIWGDEIDLTRPQLTRVLKRYEELTGNTIQVVPLSKQELAEKLPAAFNAGTIEPPDILLGYGGANIAHLKPNENFYDFTEACWIDDLTDIALNQAVYQGKVIGLPCGEASISGILYRKDIFETYNIEVPKTQEEFLSVCHQLSKKGITPMFLPYGDSSLMLYQFPLDNIVKDSNTLEALNNGTLSYEKIPDMKKILKWYKTMADSGYFGKDYFDYTWDDMDHAMQSGDYAMMIGWDTWLYTDFTGNASNIGLMPAFMGIPEEGCYEGPNIIMLMVNKKSPQLSGALDLITFIADPYNYNVALADIYTAPIFNNQMGSLTTPQYVETERQIERLFNDSTAWLRIEGFSQLDAVYIQDYMEGRSTMEECLQNMDTARIKRSSEKPDQLQDQLTEKVR